MDKLEIKEVGNENLRERVLMVKNKTINKILVLGREETLYEKKWGCEAIESCLAILDEGCGAALFSSAVPESMTDKVLNIPIYKLPLTHSYVEEVVEKEKPDAVYAPFVDSNGWDLVQHLLEEGYWQEKDIRVLGRNTVKGEEQDLYRTFRKLIAKSDLEQPLAYKISSVQEGKYVLEKLGGYPILVRSEKDGVTKVTNEKQFRSEVLLQLEKSSDNSVVIEEYLSGWKEIEAGILRDSEGAVSVVHTAENIMPMGIHSSDSKSVSPIQTLNSTQEQALVRKALKVGNWLTDFVGYCTLQFAVEPETGNILASGINFKTDRSAAVSLKLQRSLVRVVTKLVLGQTLNDLDLGDKKSRNPEAIDKLILKVPEFNFGSENSNGALNTRSKSVSEKIYVGKNFCETLRKAWSENNSTLSVSQKETIDRETLQEHLLKPYHDQLYHAAHALLLGASIEEIQDITSIDSKYLQDVKKMVEAEQQLQQSTIFSVAEKQWTLFKKLGFTDSYITHVLKTDDKFLSDRDVRNKRERLSIYPSISPFNGSYRTSRKGKKILVLADALDIKNSSPQVPVFLMVKEAQKMGFEIILITNDTRDIPFWLSFVDRLYVEPLNWEIVYEIYRRENPDGTFIKGNNTIRSQLEVRFQNIGAHIVQVPFKFSNKSLDDQVAREK